MAYSLCGTGLPNTGEQSCDRSRGIINFLKIWNTGIAASDYGTASTLFNKQVAMSKLSKSDPSKLIVLPQMEEIADASEANTEASLGLGFKAVVREGKPAYNCKILAGADLVKRLRKLNGKIVRFSENDSNQTEWLTKIGTKAYGFRGKFFFNGVKSATGQGLEEGVASFTVSVLSTTEYYDNCFWVDMSGFNQSDIRPLIDVVMAKVSHASNVHQISFRALGSNLIGDGYNIIPEVGTALAALYAQFTAFSGSGETPSTSLTITSMAVNGSNIAVTYDNTAYGTATGNIWLKPPTPTQLDAGDVVDTEILPVLYAKP